MPWLSVNHTRLLRFSAVPMPILALEVQRGSIPGAPGAWRSELLTMFESSHQACGDRSVVFTFVVCGFSLSVIRLPGLRNYVGVNRLGFFSGHFHVRKSKLRRISKSGHALVPMSAGEDDGLPLLMNFRRSVTQIGNCAIKDPGTAAVGARRVTAIANPGPVELRALLDHLLIPNLFWRLRNGRNDIGRSRERHGRAQLECVQARGPALGLWSCHGPGRGEQPRARSPADRDQHILLAPNSKRNRNRLDR